MRVQLPNSSLEPHLGAVAVEGLEGEPFRGGAIIHARSGKTAHSQRVAREPLDPLGGLHPALPSRAAVSIVAYSSTGKLGHIVTEKWVVSSLPSNHARHLVSLTR
jgi:hypothetical protein